MIAYVLIVFMAGSSFSTTLSMQEFSDREACAAAKEWVDQNSGNVRKSVCQPKSSKIGPDTPVKHVP